MKKYTTEEIREFAQLLNANYEAQLTVPLAYKEFRAEAYNLMYNNPKSFAINRIEDNTHIRIARSTKEMLQTITSHINDFERIKRTAPTERIELDIKELSTRLLTPAFEFDYTPPRVDIAYNGKVKLTPMWFNTTMKGVNMRLGYDRGDSSTPSLIQLGDKNVHMMLGGETGAGKSVALNTIECNLLVEYPPWEVDIYLGDFKKVEGSRYAKTVPTPHMKIVAATSSTEFVMSVYQAIIDEMNNRSALFSQVGVQKIEDFRKKFNLVMPRVVLIVDEFTQMYENIKDSESKGNDTAAEDKKAIDMALSAIARLGRSMGIHMCLSSQQLDNLDSGVANQFSAGATLKAPAGVSNSLIGNDAGASIRGKGKGYYNLNKAGHDAKDNILTRIPYLSSELTAEESASGKQTDLLEILTQCYEKAQELKYDKGLVFYDEDASIPYQNYLNSLEYVRNYIDEKSDSFELEDEIFTETTVLYIPLGEEIKLTDTPVYCLHIKSEKNSALIIGATDDDYRNYMLKIVARGISVLEPDAKNTIISADRSILLGSGLNDLSNLSITTRAVLSPKIKNRVNTRSELLKIYEFINDTNGTGQWDIELMFKYIQETESKTIRNTYTSINRLIELYVLFIDDLLDGMSDDALPERRHKEEWELTLTLFGRIWGIQYLYCQFIEKGAITVQSFPKEFVWFIGFENFQEIDDPEVKKEYKMFIENAPMVNIIPIITGRTWTKTGNIVEGVTHVLDRADKNFFMDIGMSKRVNINANSFQYTNRQTKERCIVSRYFQLEE